MKRILFAWPILLLALFTGAHAAGKPPTDDLAVKITRDIPSITVMDHGHKVVIERNQNPDNTIVPEYAKTSRECPPFCVQPIQLLPGVHTIGEIELIQMLKRHAEGDNSIMLIDSRTPDWYLKGTIPSSVNIPWTMLYRGPDNFDPFIVENLLTEKFDAKVKDGIWDFRGAKKLILFCNGPWCGQSATNIKELVSMGYPADKLYWYRGGMQSWHSLGLTTIKPNE